MTHFLELFNTPLAYLQLESVDDVEAWHFSRKVFSYEEEYFKRICEAFDKPCGKAMTTDAHETSSDSASDGAAASKKDNDIAIPVDRGGSGSSKAVGGGAGSGRGDDAASEEVGAGAGSGRCGAERRSALALAADAAATPPVRRSALALAADAAALPTVPRRSAVALAADAAALPGRSASDSVALPLLSAADAVALRWRLHRGGNTIVLLLRTETHRTTTI